MIKISILISKISIRIDAKSLLVSIQKDITWDERIRYGIMIRVSSSCP